MAWQFDITSLLNLILGLGVPVGAYYLRGIRDEVAEIARQLQRLNGRVTRIEEWRESTTKLQDERHARLMHDLERMDRLRRAAE